MATDFIAPDVTPSIIILVVCEVTDAPNKSFEVVATALNEAPLTENDRAIELNSLISAAEAGADPPCPMNESANLSSNIVNIYSATLDWVLPPRLQVLGFRDIVPPRSTLSVEDCN